MARDWPQYPKTVPPGPAPSWSRRFGWLVSTGAAGGTYPPSQHRRLGLLIGKYSSFHLRSAQVTHNQLLVMYWGRDTVFRAKHGGYNHRDEQLYKQGLTIWQSVTVHGTSAFLSQRTRWEYNRYQTTTRQPPKETAGYSKHARRKGADQASRGRQNHKAFASSLIPPAAGYLSDKNQWLTISCAFF